MFLSRPSVLRACLRLPLLVAAMVAAYALGRFPATSTSESPRVSEAKLSASVGVPDRLVARASSPTALLSPTVQELVERIRQLAADPDDPNNIDIESLAEIKTAIASLNPAELPALLRALDSDPDKSPFNQTRTAIMRRLAAQDPVLALQLAATTTKSEIRGMLYGTAMEAVAAKNPRQALQLLASIPYADMKGHYEEVLRMVVRDRNSYNDEYDEVPAGRVADPEGAAAFALNLPPGWERSSVINDVARAWAEKGQSDPFAANGQSNPEPAMKLLLNIPLEDRQDGYVILRALAMDNPAAAAAYFDQIPAGDREYALREIVSQWSAGKTEDSKPVRPGDPAAALAWLNQHASGPELAEAVESLFYSLPDGNLAPVLEGIDQIKDPRIRQSAIYELAGTWGERDPKAMLDWMQSQPDVDTTAITDKLLITWASADLAIAAAIAQNSPDLPALLAARPKHDDHDPFAAQGDSESTQALASTKAQDQLDFALSLPEGEARNQISLHAVERFLTKDFSSAWNQAATLPEGESRDYVMQNLLPFSIQKDIAGAAALLNQFSPGPAMLESTQVIARRWIDQDPRAMSEWVSALPQGDMRDTAAVELINVQVKKNPADVLSWANSLANPTLRAEQLTTVLKAVQKTDPAAALDAARSANLPTRQRAALIQSLARPQSNSAGNSAP